MISEKQPAGCFSNALFSRVECGKKKDIMKNRTNVRWAIYI